MEIRKDSVRIPDLLVRRLDEARHVDISGVTPMDTTVTFARPRSACWDGNWVSNGPCFVLLEFSAGLSVGP